VPVRVYDLSFLRDSLKKVETLWPHNIFKINQINELHHISDSNLLGRGLLVGHSIGGDENETRNLKKKSSLKTSPCEDFTKTVCPPVFPPGILLA
jgi:hypothetical protein